MFLLYQIFNYKYSTNILYCELLFTNVANFIDNVDFFLINIPLMSPTKTNTISTQKRHHLQRKVLRYQRGN